MSFARQISAISKSSFYNIRDLRRIRNTIDQTTAYSISTSLIHSKGYLRTDIPGIDQASVFNLTHISLLFTAISIRPIFILYDM